VTLLVCSLKTNGSQLIEPGGYRIVRFPFGSAEPQDIHGMHQTVQPDGAQVTSWQADDRSGLIWPAVEGRGLLSAMVQWEAASEDAPYTELRDQFVRDPLGFTEKGADTTATDHRPPSPGIQCFSKTWPLDVFPGVPLALRVAHNDGAARRLTLAELKLDIHPKEP
jgi:hypothetical protein